MSCSKCGCGDRIGDRAVIAFDVRDGSRDRYMDAKLAHKLYKEGKLFLDLTNSNNMRTVYGPEDGYETEIRLLTTENRYGR